MIAFSRHLTEQHAILVNGSESSFNHDNDNCISGKNINNILITIITNYSNKTNFNFNFDNLNIID